MRTRAQNSRDAALRRLTRVNHSLAVAAVVGAGVVTDIVANIPLGHARTITTSGETSATGGVTLLTSPQYSPTHKSGVRPQRAATHRSATASGAGDPPAAGGSDGSSQSQQSSSAASSASSAQSAPAPAPQPAPQPVIQPAPQPTVVAVSGGS